MLLKSDLRSPYVLLTWAYWVFQQSLVEEE